MRHAVVQYVHRPRTQSNYIRRRRATVVKQTISRPDRRARRGEGDRSVGPSTGAGREVLRGTNSDPRNGSTWSWKSCPVLAGSRTSSSRPPVAAPFALVSCRALQSTLVHGPCPWVPPIGGDVTSGLLHRVSSWCAARPLTRALWRLLQGKGKPSRHGLEPHAPAGPRPDVPSDRAASDCTLCCVSVDTLEQPSVTWQWPQWPR